MKDKINAALQKVTAFTETRYMKILMNGFMGITAITICGSLFTLIKSIPIGPWIDFLNTSGLGSILSIPVAITTEAISLYIVLSMAYETAKSYGKDGLPAALVSLGAFLLMTPFETMVNIGETMTPVTGVVPTSALGTQGMFLAIITGILASRLYIFFIDKGWKISMPSSVPANISKMFETLIPGGLVFLVFLVIRYGLSLTSFQTAQNLIYGMLQKPLTNVGGGLGGILVYFVVSGILWLFGIHGGMVAYVGMAPIITLMITENAAAFAAGLPVPHPEWAVWNFSMLGGGGATLALNLLMISKLCKSEQYKTLGKLALPTSLFNINEPIMFGTPVIMNPTLAVPYFITPIVNLLVSVAAIKIGFFVPTGANINNFMPVGIYGALITGSWTGVVMTLVLLAIDLAIYLPFFKALDSKTYKAEQENARLQQEQA